MNAQIKRQIDDLTEYTISIKNMYDKIAMWSIIPEELSKEEQDEIHNILLVINKALEIERKKIDAMNIENIDIEAVKDYLIKFYKDIECDDFLYENHLERARVLNRINAKIMFNALKYNKPIENKNIENAVFSAIRNNYIYATDYEANKDKDNIGFSYLKYAQIFLSPIYDRDFFPNCRIKPIVHYSHFKGLMQSATEDEIKETALKIIDREYTEIIEVLYNGFNNQEMDDDSVFDRAMHNLMLMNAGLISTLDPTFIDSAFLKFQKLKKDEEEYSQINGYIQGILIRSKKQVLTYTQKNKDSR